MLVRSPYFDPQYMRIVLDEMVYEQRDRIQLMYHSWGVTPIIENKTIKGVIFESKEGRKAILAKQVIDATGDGDIFAQSGAAYQSLADSESRSATTALVYRVGGINWDLFQEWRSAHPEAAQAFSRGLISVAGYRTSPLPTNNNTVCWMNNWHSERDCTSIKDQTYTEVTTRLSIGNVINYMKEACPVAFRDAFLYDIAPQLGTRCSRRLQGEYVMSTDDFAFARKHDDVIAWHSTICQINDCGPVEIPLRAIMAKGCENLLAPGRHLSADPVAIDWLNLIPQCTGTGQGRELPLRWRSWTVLTSIMWISERSRIYLPANRMYRFRGTAIPTAVTRNCAKNSSTVCTPILPKKPQQRERSTPEGTGRIPIQRPVRTGPRRIS
jgi:hypothetical protein